MELRLAQTLETYKELARYYQTVTVGKQTYVLIRLLRGQNEDFIGDYHSNSGFGSPLDRTKAISKAFPG